MPLSSSKINCWIRPLVKEAKAGFFGSTPQLLCTLPAQPYPSSSPLAMLHAAQDFLPPLARAMQACSYCLPQPSPLCCYSALLQAARSCSFSTFPFLNHVTNGSLVHLPTLPAILGLVTQLMLEGYLAPLTPCTYFILLVCGSKGLVQC